MRVARVVSVAVVATLALLPLRQTDSSLDYSYCTQLEALNIYNMSAERTLLMDGVEREVLVAGGGEAPARAAAALVAAVLRRVLRYRRVRLWPSAPADLPRLHAHPHMPRNYSQLVVAPNVEWGSRGAWRERRRLVVLDRGLAADLGLRLHVHIAERARTIAACDNPLAIMRDSTLLALCSFRCSDDRASNHSMACELWAVLTLVENTPAVKQLDLSLAGLPLRVTPLLSTPGDGNEARQLLMKMLKDSDYSFFFLDYNFWTTGDNRVQPVCPPAPFLCNVSLDSPVKTNFAADEWQLKEYAPPIYETLQLMAPTPEHLREVLELEACGGYAGSTSGLDIEEAACASIIQSQPLINAWLPLKEGNQPYWVYVYMCNDNDYATYFEFLEAIWSNMTYFQTDIKLGLKCYKIECNETSELSPQLVQASQNAEWRRVVGAVAPGSIAGAQAAIERAKRLRLSLLLFDAPAPDVTLQPAARLATGSHHHVARAVRFFLTQFGWHRIVVLTDSTPAAEGLADAVLASSDLRFRRVSVGRNSTSSRITATLIRMRDAGARIFLVSADMATTTKILCAAFAARMSTDEYVWIVNQRSTESWCSNTSGLRSGPGKHFSIGSGWRDGEWAMETEGWREGRDVMHTQWAGVAWPPHAAGLADALRVLRTGFQSLLRGWPDRRYDLHATHILRIFSEVFYNTNTSGMVQDLQYRGDERVPHNPLVFVDEWRDGDAQCSSVAVLRIEDESVRTLHWRNPYPSDAPSDGLATCYTTHSGDLFTPRCGDGAYATALVVLLLAAVALWWARRVRLGRLKRRDREFTARLLVRNEPDVKTLAAHLIDREAIELEHELGAGRFGRVWFGMLRIIGRRPTAVAAKALREHAAPAEETEFLREACTLAMLDHENVIKLVGVCATGGPPLVLMEHAFFGDLLRYLRERKHFAERAISSRGPETEGGGIEQEEEEEAAQVSAEALTRFAREAATALSYLAQRRIVHRDVRAANCLVDSRRTLKLADFGMAREVSGGGEGAAEEYACRRRALFPVLWMAPESLSRGVFSAASDVWALGVLLLELVTLGARPYGSWSPLRVLRFVDSGGHPPIPLYATPQTRGVALLCWRREAEQRPSASDVVAYLSSRPRALAPALHPPAGPDLATDLDSVSWSDATNFPSSHPDSGFGEPAEFDFNTN